MEKPLNSFDLKALGDPGPAIEYQRKLGQGRPIDWTGCGLVAAYGLPGDPGHAKRANQQALVA